MDLIKQRTSAAMQLKGSDSQIALSNSDVSAKVDKQQALVAEIQGRLELCRAGKPYREPEKAVDDSHRPGRLWDVGCGL